MKKIIYRKRCFLRPMLTIFFFIFSYCFSIPVVFAESSCVLKMGWEPWKPYQYIDENKQLTGLDIDLIRAIVKNMGCEVQLEKTPWRRQLFEAEYGRMHLVASASMTEERKKWAYFSESYREHKRVLFVLKGTVNRYQFESLKDIIGTDFNLGVVRGVYQGEEFARLINSPQFKKQV